MRLRRAAVAGVPLVVAAAAVAALSLWLALSAAPEMSSRVPGTDTSGDQPRVTSEGGPGSGYSVRSTGEPADVPGSWPRFRGSRFDGVSDDETPLARSWGEGGPPTLWSLDVGEGYAGAAILAGRVYMLDYDRDEQADVLRCFSLADGKDIWGYRYPVKVKRNHGMSRSVPAVTDKYVVSLGPKCHVVCAESMTGELRWTLDLVKDFGAKVPPWYAGQCPLIDGDRAILAPAGDSLMIAVDCETGKVVWKTPNPDGWTMTHSSVMPMELGGRRMYVYCASGGVVGVSAENGDLLWKTPEWKISIANVPSPVILGEGRIFFTGGYSAGSMLVQVEDDAGRLKATTVLRLEPKAFDSPQQTPVLYKGMLYAVRSDGRLACADLNATVAWDSGSANKFGLGPYMIADGLLFVMNDRGVLTLAEATPTGYTELAQAKVLHGHDSWGPMALAGGRLIVRDLTRMVCLDVRAK